MNWYPLSGAPTLHQYDYSQGAFTQALIEWIFTQQALGRIPIPKVVAEAKSS